MQPTSSMPPDPTPSRGQDEEFEPSDRAPLDGQGREIQPSAAAPSDGQGQEAEPSAPTPLDGQGGDSEPVDARSVRAEDLGVGGAGGAGAGRGSAGGLARGRRPRPPKLYRIGEVVEYSGMSRQTIHNYTTMGLLQEMSWTPGGHRLYPESVFGRLDHIAELKAQRKSMEHIRKYFAQLDRI